MTTIALASCFRNMEHRISAWEAPVHALRQLVGGLHLKLVWGDSFDKTSARLQRVESESVDVIERSHGGPHFSSTEDSARLKALTFVGNGVLESIGPEIDVLIYVESDLLWAPQTMIHLIQQLGPDVDAVAPLIYAGANFYDVWGFRGLDGQRFGPFHPYHSDLKFDGSLTEVGSVGSCLVMKGDVARRCRMIQDYAFVGFCQDIRAKGYRIWVDAQSRIDHP